ncbi:hypothetical protein, partial [Enterobacter hormaechei]
PGGGDGLHTVFPLKMPGGGVGYPPAFSRWAGHPTAPRAYFFINTGHKLFIKFPPHFHPNASPPRQVNHGNKKTKPHTPHRFFIFNQPHPPGVFTLLLNH